MHLSQNATFQNVPWPKNVPFLKNLQVSRLKKNCEVFPGTCKIFKGTFCERCKHNIVYIIKENKY